MKYLFALMLLGIAGLAPLVAQPARSLDHFFLMREAKASLVLLRNANTTVPWVELAGQRRGYVALGVDSTCEFQTVAARYAQGDRYSIPWNMNDGPASLSRLGSDRDQLLLGIFPAGWERLSAGMRRAWEHALAEVQQQPGVVVVLFGEPEALSQFSPLPQAQALILAGGASPSHQSVGVQTVFGALGASNRLVKDVSPFFLQGNGLRSPGGLRLAYDAPEAVGWNGDWLQARFDSIIQSAIDSQAFPGCQLLVAKGGTVVFHQAYGHHTYAQDRPVEESHLYDLASVTKVTGPLPLLMQLHDDAKLNLDLPLATYWPDFFWGDKATMTVREVLAHQARLKPYITFYKQTMRDNGTFRWRTIRSDSSARYPHKVDDDLFLHRRWPDRMLKAVRDTPLLAETEYVYSGLSFLLYPAMIRQLTGTPYAGRLRQEFLDPLGADLMGFRPLQRVPRCQVVPTEYDSTFRRRQVWGYVHDENAAMLGGVSGNAGLFANCHDLAKLLQMYLNGGEYGGKRYLSEETLAEFTAYQFDDNRRGLGFDKPPRRGMPPAYMAESANEASYGHSGFTGTVVWVDPEEELLFIFLSNRVYPTRNNRQLYRLKVRETLHQACYDALPVNWRR